MIDPEAPYLGSFICSVCDRRQNVLATNSKKWLIRVNPSKTREAAEGGKLEVAWDIFCPECKTDQPESGRWTRKEYYCQHCVRMIPLEIYRDHVIECLSNEIQHKLNMNSNPPTKTASPAIALADGPSED